MKRDIYNRLKEWKLSERRKPLIMYGARQVGKTYIIKEFGSHEFDNMVYVNCYKNETIAQLFQGDVNIERILIGLSAFAKQSITPGKTLVFLDEIQEIPPVLSSLKYFCENKPEFHLIVAGSLLGVMNMRGESFPVGKVDIMHLYLQDILAYLKYSLYICQRIAAMIGRKVTTICPKRWTEKVDRKQKKNSKKSEYKQNNDKQNNEEKSNSPHCLHHGFRRNQHRPCRRGNVDHLQPAQRCV